MTPTYWRRTACALALSTAALIAACGGGSDPAADAGSPVAQSADLKLKDLAVAYDTGAIDLRWSAAPDADAYEVQVDSDGPAGPEPAVRAAVVTGVAYQLAPTFTQRLDPSLQMAVRACLGSNCGEPAWTGPLDPLAAVGRIKKHLAVAHEGMGSAVALSGDGLSLAVAVVNEDTVASGISASLQGDTGTALNASSAAVVVYTRGHARGAWAQQAVIKPRTVLGFGSNFGAVLAFSHDGNTLAVGAPDDSSDDAGVVQGRPGSAAIGNPSTGAAYIFVRSQGAWSEQAYVKADVPQAGDVFGAAVALSGDGKLLAIGAPANDVQGTDAGAAFLYAQQGGTWSPIKTLVASNPEAGDYFGSAVALSGDGKTLAVSAPAEGGGLEEPVPGAVGDIMVGGNFAPGSGAVYVFAEPSAWAQQAYVKGSRNAAQSGFGIAVSLSGDGDTLAVGAPADDHPGAADAAFADTNDSGAAYVFRRTGTTWAEAAFLKASQAQAATFVGVYVAVSGDGRRVAVSSPLAKGTGLGLNADEGDTSGTNVGAVWVYEQQAGAWAPRSYIKAPHSAADGLAFGSGVAWSSDGETLAIGAHGDGSADASGVPVVESGAAFVY